MEYTEGYQKSRNQSIGLLKILQQKTHITGLENLQNGAGFITPNHPSWKDIPLIASQIPRQIYFVATNEIFDSKILQQQVENMFNKYHPFLKYLTKPFTKIIYNTISDYVTRADPIKIDKKDNYKGFYQKTKNSLLDDKLVLIFPARRGKRKPGEIIKTFQPSFSQITYDLFSEDINIPIYPTCIYWAKGGNSKFFFDEAYITIEKPIYIKDYLTQNPKRTIINFTKETQKKVNSQMENLIELFNKQGKCAIAH